MPIQTFHPSEIHSAEGNFEFLFQQVRKLRKLRGSGWEAQGADGFQTLPGMGTPGQLCQPFPEEFSQISTLRLLPLLLSPDPKSPWLSPPVGICAEPRGFADPELLLSPTAAPAALGSLPAFPAGSFYVLSQRWSSSWGFRAITKSSSRSRISPSRSSQSISAITKPTCS